MDTPGNKPEPEAQQYVSKSTFNDCWAELQSVKLAAREAEAKAERLTSAFRDLEDHNAYLLERLQEAGQQLTDAKHTANQLRVKLTILASCARVYVNLVDAKAQVYSKEDRELLSVMTIELKNHYTACLK